MSSSYKHEILIYSIHENEYLAHVCTLNQNQRKILTILHSTFSVWKSVIVHLLFRLFDRDSDTLSNFLAALTSTNACSNHLFGFTRIRTTSPDAWGFPKVNNTFIFFWCFSGPSKYQIMLSLLIQQKVFCVSCHQLILLYHCNVSQAQ